VCRLWPSEVKRFLTPWSTDYCSRWQGRSCVYAGRVTKVGVPVGDLCVCVCVRVCVCVCVCVCVVSMQRMCCLWLPMCIVFAKVLRLCGRTLEGDPFQILACCQANSKEASVHRASVHQLKRGAGSCAPKPCITAIF